MFINDKNDSHDGKKKLKNKHVNCQNLLCHVCELFCWINRCDKSFKTLIKLKNLTEFCDIESLPCVGTTVASRRPWIYRNRGIQFSWFSYKVRNNFQYSYISGVYAGSIAFEWQPRGRRRPGRLVHTWQCTVESETRTAGMTWNDVKKQAQDSMKWRKLVRALCTCGVH